MDKALKAKWLEALRSGRYKQGRYRLRNNRDEFCCLGVLCDVSGLGEWEHLPGKGYTYKRGEEDDNMTYQQGDRLMGMNDNDRLSFPAIAEWIEENIKGG